MDGINLIQDLAMVLLAAGIAGTVCRRFGLSVVVGYLVAGIIVGPYTPPFSFILDVDRIQTLSQIGLVFLMFNIGLGLSLSKLGRFGWPLLVATGLGAFLMMNLTQLLGFIVGWDSDQALFVAAMFMCSSSAVIAKITGELNLNHDRAGQLALSVTVLEDVVAVIMLTILASRTGGDAANVGSVVTGMTAFVVLLLGVGLLMVPRLLRRLEARADPELQTIIVAGLLFLLAIAAVKAGYSLALGAFLLGAIVAEIPQKSSVEKAFAGMRDLFSSVFFVSIGMLIEIRLLAGVWPWVLALGLFAIVGRALATGVALMLSGTPPPVARRASLLLGPLGEFTFIIAQLGVASAVLPADFYPLAVGVSIFTVLVAPIINRHAEPILRFMERIEPAWFQRAVEAYQGWLGQVHRTAPPSLGWKLIRPRLGQIAVEVLLVTGVMAFSRQMLALLLGRSTELGLDSQTLVYGFWGVISVVVLVPLVAIWRNIAAIAMIFAESLGGDGLVPVPLVQRGFKAFAAVALGYWLYVILPTEELGAWGWVLIGFAAVVVVTVFSSQLIYWHSHWQSSVRDVLAEDPAVAGAAAAGEARHRRQRDLQQWDVQLNECIVPDAASYAGRTLLDIAIPSRFGCAVIEIERNGIVITTIRPDLGLYPGDKLLLMGRPEQIESARRFLAQEQPIQDQAEAFRGSVLETFEIPAGPRTGPTLAELKLAQVTGTRIVGIRRGDQKIIAPSGQEHLEAGDNVLVAGTLSEIATFRRWLKSAP
jgi:CPA2 family monovalent cation:H+ antiporter-2